jgi:hypothetical protein
MIGLDRGALARDYTTQSPHVPVFADLPEIDDSTLLDRFLARLCERIKAEGLTSLYWVSGIHTQEIASALLRELAETAGGQQFNEDDRFCIVIKPLDRQIVQPFNRQYAVSIGSMNEFYIDSFVVVNEKAMLDVTPVAADEGNPEYNDDPTIVSLYIGLFNMLRNGTTPL